MEMDARGDLRFCYWLSRQRGFGWIWGISDFSRFRVNLGVGFWYNVRDTLLVELPSLPCRRRKHRNDLETDLNILCEVRLCVEHLCLEQFFVDLYRKMHCSEALSV